MLLLGQGSYALASISVRDLTLSRFAPNETQMALDNMTSFATEVVGRALGVAVAGPKEKVDMTGVLGLGVGVGLGLG